MFQSCPAAHTATLVRTRATCYAGMVCDDDNGVIVAHRLLRRRGSDVRILIAEDEAIIAHDIKSIVEHFGHTVVGIVDMVEDVLTTVATVRPDIVLLDIHLRGNRDGIAAGHTLRDTFHVPVVYLTAHADAETVRRAAATQPFGYLLKPFSEQALQSTLEVAHYKYLMERRLQLSEQRFVTTLRSIGDGVIVTDLAGQVTFINAVGATLTGIAPEVTLGQSLAEVLVLIDGATSLPITDLVAHTLQTDSIVTFATPTVLCSHDGRTWPVNGSAAPIHDDTDANTGVVVVFREISAQVQAEQERQRAAATLLQHNLQLSATVASLTQRTTEVTVLSTLGGELLRSSAIEECYAVIVKAARRLFTDADGTLYIQRTASAVAEAVAIWGSSAERPSLLTVETCWALCHHQVLSEVEHDPRCSCVGTPPDEIYWTLCVPLVVDTSINGVLHMRLPRVADPLRAPSSNAARKQLAIALAEQASLGLANIRMRILLREQSIRDPLTGLFNRRYLEEILVREQHRSARSHHPIGIILLDIDHFKQVNDTWGHPAGDLVLIALSRLLSAQVRAEDSVYRYGGEEFLLVLPSASEAVTFSRAEQIRQQVPDLHVVYLGQILPSITISIGIAVIWDQTEQVSDALKRADDALYQAKHAGRNCTVVSAMRRTAH